MLGKPVPDLSLPSTGGTAFQISSTRGSRLVLSFHDNYPAFRRANCEVFGISRGSLASPQRFREKMKFPFEVPGHVQEVLNFVKAL